MPHAAIGPALAAHAIEWRGPSRHIALGRVARALHGIGLVGIAAFGGVVRTLFQNHAGAELAAGAGQQSVVEMAPDIAIRRAAPEAHTRLRKLRVQRAGMPVAAG